MVHTKIKQTPTYLNITLSKINTNGFFVSKKVCHHAIKSGLLFEFSVGTLQQGFFFFERERAQADNPPKNPWGTICFKRVQYSDSTVNSIALSHFPDTTILYEGVLTLLEVTTDSFTINKGFRCLRNDICFMNITWHNLKENIRVHWGTKHLETNWSQI